MDAVARISRLLESADAQAFRERESHPGGNIT